MTTRTTATIASDLSDSTAGAC